LKVEWPGGGGRELGYYCSRRSKKRIEWTKKAWIKVNQHISWIQEQSNQFISLTNKSWPPFFCWNSEKDEPMRATIAKRPKMRFWNESWLNSYFTQIRVDSTLILNK
jgi:hypothetical protein